MNGHSVRAELIKGPRRLAEFVLLNETGKAGSVINDSNFGEAVALAVDPPSKHRAIPQTSKNLSD
jgi:hypothetical protein